METCMYVCRPYTDIFIYVLNSICTCASNVTAFFLHINKTCPHLPSRNRQLQKDFLSLDKRQNIPITFEEAACGITAMADEAATSKPAANLPVRPIARMKGIFLGVPYMFFFSSLYTSILFSSLFLNEF